MEAILQCQNISKRIGKFYLQDIHFNLEPGYILGVIGRSGAGKSTLVRILLGSYKLHHYSGKKWWRTEETKGMEDNQGDVLACGYSIKAQTKEYKEQLAFILNENPFVMSRSAKENGSYFGAYYKDFQEETYKELCMEYGVPFEKPLEKLSKGEQIKMQLAFALARDAKVFVFDEPAGNLDVKFRDTFYNQMRDIVSGGDKSIVYVTHLVEELEQLADYVLWMEEGKQKEFCTLEEMLDKYWLFEGKKEMLCDLKEGQIVWEKENAVHYEALLCAREPLPKEILQKCRRAELKEIL